MIRILLVDDHEVVRMGLTSLLQAESDLEVVGDVGSAAEAIAFLDETPADVAVVDIVMPDVNGLGLLGMILEQFPQTAVVMLSMHADEGYVVDALRQGASGYVLKDAGADDVIAAVRSAAGGERYLSRLVSERAIDAYISAAPAHGARDRISTLSERELEIIRAGARGETKGQIAARLFISARTVETHRANAMRKLDLHSQTDLVHYAIRCGLVEPEVGAEGD